MTRFLGLGGLLDVLLNPFIHTPQSNEAPTAALLLQALVTAGDHVPEGARIVAVTLPWRAIIAEIAKDPKFLFHFVQAPRKFEEFIAGAYERAGYDVILTPQRGDFGRDVIASKDGFGSIRILDQAKAFSPGHQVGHEELRAMLGVLSADQNASKAVISTTSTFLPGVLTSPEFTKFMPYRLELKDGAALSAWLEELRQNNPNP
ncbi:restriction endonuclease [Mesorhizobium sp.]|uniref:restriction endonuclease n=1 Tax=Mesorhizobium sp. TaxID=1871066 RepID=UPI000FE52E36|nr:restriction endonuclease [Mesorhizobium sp.]RWD74793.1 MAG: restriction endonuclease [Mesorhizobium sp.]